MTTEPSASGISPVRNGLTADARTRPGVPDIRMRSSADVLDDRNFLTALGDRVRAAGLTQAWLAAACGPHRTFVGSVERGERNVSVPNLRPIARHLRVPAASLVTGPV